MSSTGPITCTTRPMLWFLWSFPGIVAPCESVLLFYVPSVLGGGRRAAHDLDDLLGDRGLTNFIHIQCKLIDQLSGIVRRRIHSRHARRMFRRRRFGQSAKNLHLYVARQQTPEKLIRRLLEEIVHGSFL